MQQGEVQRWNPRASCGGDKVHCTNIQAAPPAPHCNRSRISLKRRPESFDRRVSMGKGLPPVSELPHDIRLAEMRVPDAAMCVIQGSSRGLQLVLLIDHKHSLLLYEGRCSRNLFCHAPCTSSFTLSSSQLAWFERHVE